MPTKQAIACVPCAESFYKEFVGDETCSPCLGGGLNSAVALINARVIWATRVQLAARARSEPFADPIQSPARPAPPHHTLSPAANASGLCVCDRALRPMRLERAVYRRGRVFKASAAQATCEACPCARARRTGAILATTCKCVPGFGVVENGTSCEICAANTFKAELASVACTPCPAFAEAGEGAVTRENCTCRETFVATADGSCTCPAGTFFNNATQTCRDCAANRYKTLPGFDACQTCPEFSVSEAGSVNRTQCTCAIRFRDPGGIVLAPPAFSTRHASLSRLRGRYLQPPARFRRLPSLS